MSPCARSTRRRMMCSCGDSATLLRNAKAKWNVLRRAIAARSLFLIDVLRFASICASTLRTCHGARPCRTRFSEGDVPSVQWRVRRQQIEVDGVKPTWPQLRRHRLSMRPLSHEASHPSGKGSGPCHICLPTPVDGGIGLYMSTRPIRARASVRAAVVVSVPFLANIAQSACVIMETSFSASSTNK